MVQWQGGITAEVEVAGASGHLIYHNVSGMFHPALLAAAENPLLFLGITEVS